ncbi:MAG: SDR family oxidoreductase [Gammaproteobacteria bacterium]|jgi:NAD(P)-dependent dehydrogenase (short-subunit alcohol dehydrogenase family)
MNKIFVITGASSGIGKALALALATRGKKVLAIARNLNALKQLQKHSPTLIDIINADIATLSGRKKILSYVSSSKTKILALVNNAALMSPSGFLENINLKEWKYQMAVNVEAPLFLTKDLLPFLRGGRILNITIYSSFNVTPGLGAYGISKAALNMMTEYFRAEFKKYHIAVGSVLPGIVDTNIQKQLPSAKAFAVYNKIKQLKSENKLLRPEAVASFLSWLLLDVDSMRFSKDTWDIYNTKQRKDWAAISKK